MAYLSPRHRFLASLLLVFLLAVCPTAARAQANVPPLAEFIEQVRNGDATSPRGIYIPGVLADVVTQQPEHDPAFVSTAENTLTQFGPAASHGSIGLLAHNSLAGKDFFRLGEGQLLYLIYGDGSLAAFRVTHLLRAQALSPEHIWSNFIDLDTGGLLTAAHLFDNVYDQPGRLILQTCIEAHGNPSWGRLFVIAEPYTNDSPAWLFEPEVMGYVSTLKIPAS